MGKIVYGSELSLELKETLKENIKNLKIKRVPTLAVILVGDDPASKSYVKGKDKACNTVGMNSIMINLDADIKEDFLIKKIKELNEDDNVDGILVQLPLPKGLNESIVLDNIDPDKDVDGLHRVNVGKLYLGEPGFVPCTPRGIIELLKKMEVNIEGKHAVVIGRSKLVGLPVSKLLLNENASVTICHSRTKNLKEICKTADILVVAVGKAKMINADYVKENAYVIDVGVNRVDGKLCGDCDFDSIVNKCAAITPVPKGVGPMTITMLLYNTFDSFKKREGLSDD
jgi:methylenetetrahydrofolate dehydrogenase (NADP+)/methenyltetrahydrofolate cyclohydrolase